MEIRVWVLKITGIAGIHAISINLKSLHSDFPAKSLQFPVNICSVAMKKNLSFNFPSLQLPTKRKYKHVFLIKKLNSSQMTGRKIGQTS